ncbi:hypothetical protein SDJN02_16234, partial [Cucurbita argyrosperma subsp. argyrosperma]
MSVAHLSFADIQLPCPVLCLYLGSTYLCTLCVVECELHRSSTWGSFIMTYLNSNLLSFFHVLDDFGT